jgi:hypothetical protein
MAACFGQSCATINANGVREPSLRALLRELAAFNEGLCVITTRLAVADLAQHEGSSAQRRNLEHLSSQAGEKLARLFKGRGRKLPNDVAWKSKLVRLCFLCCLLFKSSSNLL